jgi:hypothetical protein
MKHHPLLLPVVFGLSLLTLASCINLKKVNDYSSCSLESIKNFECIDYSFTKACYESGKLQRIRNAEFRLDTSKFDCSTNQLADSITLLIYNTVRGYFEGLTKLSNNELTEYHTDNLATALIKARISDSTAHAYSKISTVLLHALTDEYRKKKIQQYIGEANEAIKVLLDELDFQLSQNLVGKLKTQELKINNIYYGFFLETNQRDTIFHSSHNLTADTLYLKSKKSYERLLVVKDYDAALAELKNKENQILCFTKGLRKIAEGHQKLYDNRNNLSVNRCKELISLYASNIQDEINEFNILKKSKH